VLHVYRQGREVARIPTVAPRQVQLAAPPLGDPGVLEDLRDLGNNLMKIGTATKWIGIGVLALAGGVLLFRLTEFVFGE